MDVFIPVRTAVFMKPSQSMEDLMDSSHSKLTTDANGDVLLLSFQDTTDICWTPACAKKKDEILPPARIWNSISSGGLQFPQQD